MRNAIVAWDWILVACIAISALQVAAQTTGNNDRSTGLPPDAVILEVPAWVPIAINPQLYWWWRKYGPWDYKVQSSKFRDFTFFNFGATGASAKMPQQVLLKLAQAAVPVPTDLFSLDQPNLARQFTDDEAELEALRQMASVDERLTRIAVDFTWLRDNSKWPRNDVGLTPSRWSDYRKRFEKLNIHDGVFRTDDFPGAIFFVRGAKGLCVAGSSSGFVYSEQPLGPTSEAPIHKLDSDFRSLPDRKTAFVFRSLKSNWYAFYEADR